MMTKKRSNALANLKILMVVPGLALLLVVFSTCSEKIAYTDTVVEAVAAPSNAPITKGGEPEPFVVVEKMPLFPGGDSALLRYIAENTKYPEAARANKIQGRVIVRFCITETGNVDRISVIKGVDPELDKESMRVVSTLPDFKPGMQGGKEVPVWYMVPITFALSGDKAPEMILPPPPPPPPPAGATVVKETATDRKSTDPFVIVEEMPVFPGGDMALLKFISENTKYPESAKKQNIAGRVIVRFCVNAAGNVELISVMEGVDPALDAEAIRVCSMLPAFKPGKQGGKEVPVWIMVPITFSLK